MSNGSPRVAVVVLNWNGWRDTIECLESVVRSDYANYCVVVCDNASSDDSLARITQWASAQSPRPGKAPVSLTVLPTGANLGFAGGNNVGIFHALRNGADYVWVLNNDTVVAADAMSQMTQYMESHPTIGMCGPTLLDYHSPGRVQTRGGYRYVKWSARCAAVGVAADGPNAIAEELDYVSGASMFVRRPFLDVVGLMEEGYFLYFEEIDWATRGRRYFRPGYCRAGRVFHKEGGTTGSGGARDRSLTAEYFGARNRLRVTARFWPWYLPTVFGSVILSALERLVHGHWKRAAAIFVAAFGGPPTLFKELRRLHPLAQPSCPDSREVVCP